jgi:signal transduction histidine kinase
MNYGKSTIVMVLILAGIMISCRHQGYNDPTAGKKQQMDVLFDSINKFDSLVNYYKVSDNRRSLFYARKALSSGITMYSNKAIAKGFLLMGISYYNHMNDSSFYYYTEALKLADEYNLIILKPFIFYDLSMIYYAVQDNKMAVILLDSVIQLSEKVKDYPNLSNAYNSLGNIKMNMGDSSGSRRMFEKAFKIAKEHSLSKQTGVAMGSLASIEKDQNKSKRLQKDALEYLMKSTGADAEIASILINLGLLFSNPDSAIDYYNKAIGIAKKGGSVNLEIAAYNNLAYSYLDKKEYSRAKASLFENAIPLASKTGNIDWLSTLYDSYADVCVALKNIDSAFCYARKALEKRREADTKQANGQIRLLAVLMDDKNKEIMIQMHERVIQHKQNILYLVLLILICLILAFASILSLFFLRIHKSKIRLQMQEISSAKKLMELEDHEKERIAMELHDLTTPLFLSISKQIEELKTENISLKSELQSKITSLANSIRNISHRLKSMVLGEITFYDYVTRICEDMQRLTEIPIKLRIDIADLELSGESEKHILRIIQELLTNAVKYVKTGTIELAFSFEFNNLYINYQDGGPGFDFPNKMHQGIGLMNIFERAKLLKGKADLLTSPGSDTKWKIILPLYRK